MNRAVLFILIVILAYFAVAYTPVGVNYFRIRYEAQKLANDGLNPKNRSWSRVKEFIDNVEEDTGINLPYQDVKFEQEEGESWVEVRALIPVDFPIVDTTHIHEFWIEVGASKKYGLQ